MRIFAHEVEVEQAQELADVEGSQGEEQGHGCGEGWHLYKDIHKDTYIGTYIRTHITRAAPWIR